ncbi:MAG: hypothetical protein AAB588_01710 [Patescibacteria group bacterium]
MAQNNEIAGPPSPSFLTLVLKTFAGLGGGIAGMLILLLIFLGASTILQSAINPAALGVEEAGKNPLFIFVFMAMIFLTSLGSNLLGSLFFSFVEHEKYSRTSTAMYQIFFINLVIFAVMAPIYILMDSRGLLELTGFLAGFHVLLTALASTMILEIIGNLRYALVGVYGVIFSLLISTGVIMTLYEFSGRNATMVLFATLPIMWTTLGFVTVIVEMFYRWMYTLYGSDFLMSKTEFGKDYGEPEVEDAPPPPDVTGSEFLKQ